MLNRNLQIKANVVVSNHALPVIICLIRWNVLHLYMTIAYKLNISPLVADYSVPFTHTSGCCQTGGDSFRY